MHKHCFTKHCEKDRFPATTSRSACGCASGFGRITVYTVTSPFLHFFVSTVIFKIRRYAKQLNLRHRADSELSSFSVNQHFLFLSESLACVSPGVTAWEPVSIQRLGKICQNTFKGHQRSDAVPLLSEGHQHHKAWQERCWRGAVARAGAVRQGWGSLHVLAAACGARGQADVPAGDAGTPPSASRMHPVCPGTRAEPGDSPGVAALPAEIC